MADVNTLALADGGRVDWYQGLGGFHFQKYDAAGVAVGSEYVLGNTNVGPTVTGLSSGGFVVISGEAVPKTPVNYDVRVFDPYGGMLQKIEPAGGAAPVAVTASSDGGFLLQSFHQIGGDTIVQLFDNTGAATHVGVSFPGSVTVSVQADGDYELHYTDAGQPKTLEVDPQNPSALDTAGPQVGDGGNHITIQDAVHAEGTGGVTSFDFTLTRTGVTTEAASVDYHVVYGQTDAADFHGATSGTATFAAGATSTTLHLEVNADSVNEGEEQFQVVLSNPTGALIYDGSAYGTIRNDDALFEGGMAHYALSGGGAQAEGNSGATDFTFTVTRSDDLSEAGAVDYYIWGDQTDGADFSGATSGTAYFAAGQTTQTIHINATGDTAVEGDETFHLAIVNPRGGEITTGDATATITNDDGSAGGGETGGGDTGGGDTGGETTFAISGPGSVSEGNSGATDFTFTVTRSGDLSGAGAVDYYMWGDQTDGADVSGSTGGTAYFSAGQATALVHINVNGDTTVERDETFHVSLANARGGAITTDTALGIIVNDDASSGGPSAPIVVHGDLDTYVVGSGVAATGNVITDASAGDDGDGDNGWDDPGSHGPLHVTNVQTSFGSDTDGSNGFVVAGRYGVLTLQTNGDYSYVANADAPAGVNDQFTYAVQGADGGQAYGTVLRINLVAPTTPPAGEGSTFAISSAGSLAEGNSGTTDFAFTVTRSGDLSTAGAVDYYMWGDQTDASDFSGATGGTAYFSAGQSTAVVHINVNGDTANEADESFNISLANGRGGTITTHTATAVILNDEGQAPGGGGTGGGSTSGATFAISGPGSMPEGNSGTTDFAFTVTRSGDLSGAGAVDYYLWGDQTDGSDVSGPTAGTAYFAEGQSTAVVHIGVVGDTTDEADETFHVSLANARGGTISTETSTTVIVDDDGGSSGGGSTEDHQPTLARLSGYFDMKEANLANGTHADAAALTHQETWRVTSADGVSALSFEGHSIISGGVFNATSFGFGPGTISFTGYDAATGELQLSYTLEHAVMNPLGARWSNTLPYELSGSLIVTDNDGDQASGSVDASVADDWVTAGADSILVAPGETFTGQAVVRGADSAHLVGLPFTQETELGTFSIDATGHYTFVAKEGVTGSGGIGLQYTDAEGHAPFIDDATSFGITLYVSPQFATGGGSSSPMISISGGGDVTEGDSGTTDVAFTVTRSGAGTGDAAVDWWVWGDTDGSDFSGATGGTVYFADGETSKVIHLSVAGDTTAESDEAFHLSLANARGAALSATTTADAVILHNDGWIVG